MQISNGRKALYITVSVLISVVFWFYVNSGATVDFSINNIPVEFLNESALANKGLMLLNGEETPTVDLSFTMPRSMVYNFRSERVRAIADLGSINSTGTQSLSYSIIYPPNTNRGQISVASPSVQTVSVRVGELFRRNDVEIRCKLVGNVADGYVAGSVQLLPKMLEIWGQQSDVMQVNFAQVTLNIQNARSTIVELVEFELYDYNDQLIENNGIHAASSTIQVTMPVISATDIPLVVRFQEEPGVRVDSFEYSLDTMAVTLSGDASQIAQLGEIVLGEVRLSDITDEQTIVYDIPIPDGLTNLSGVSTATLTIKNRDVGTRELTVSQFDYENFVSGDRMVEVVTSSLDVTLRGVRETLDEIKPEQVRAVADLSGVIDASGTYTVPAFIRVEGNPDVGTVQNYQLTVRIYTPETPTEEEAETQPDTETEGTATP